MGADREPQTGPKASQHGWLETPTLARVKENMDLRSGHLCMGWVSGVYLDDPEDWGRHTPSVSHLCTGGRRAQAPLLKASTASGSDMKI